MRFPRSWSSTPGMWAMMLQSAKHGAGSLPLSPNHPQNTTVTVCRGWRYCPAHLPSIYTHPLLADGQQPTADQHLSLHSPGQTTSDG